MPPSMEWSVERQEVSGFPFLAGIKSPNTPLEILEREAYSPTLDGHQKATKKSLESVYVRLKKMHDRLQNCAQQCILDHPGIDQEATKLKH